MEKLVKTVDRTPQHAAGLKKLAQTLIQATGTFSLFSVLGY